MKYFKIIPYRPVLILLPLLILMSCTAKVEKPDSTGTIPEKDFISILTEIHISDGLLANPRIQNWVYKIDSLATYNYIIDKHGYTKAAFDNTVRYYFIRKPRKLTKIYDEILAELSEMESILAKEVMLERERTSNVWPGEKNYYFPDIESISSPDFRVTLNGNRQYILKFTATLFPDDQSADQKVSISAISADSLLTGKKYYFQSPVFPKDGMPHLYYVRIFVPVSGAIQVDGSLLDTCTPADERPEHVYFEGITLSMPE